MTATSHPLNCSLALPPTPALSLTCLKEDLATASPSCLGGGSWCVGATMSPMALALSWTRAYPGLQAPQAGRISSILCKSISIFHRESKTQLTARREAVTQRGRRPLIQAPSSCSADMERSSAAALILTHSLPRSCKKQVFSEQNTNS